MCLLRKAKDSLKLKKKREHFKWNNSAKMYVQNLPCILQNYTINIFNPDKVLIHTISFNPHI